MKLYAQLMLTPSAPLPEQIVLAISFTRLVVGDSPCESNFSISLTITSSSASVSLLLCGVKNSLEVLPLILLARVAFEILKAFAAAEMEEN